MAQRNRRESSKNSRNSKALFKVGQALFRYKYSIISGLLFFIAQSCFAADTTGTDILAEPVKNVFATFKGPGVGLLTVAEIIGCHALYRKTGDMKAWIGLPVLLIVTAWAAAKF